MNLRQYLKARNIRQVDFVRSTGLSAPVVSKLCSSKYAPRASVSVIRKIYEATDGAVTADDLLGLSRLPAAVTDTQAAE